MTDEGRHAADSGSGGTGQPGGPDDGTAAEGTQATPGRIRRQDENTAPREPTLAESRAREQKIRADREAVRLKEARSKKNKRLLIGGGATVGVVALIAAVYAASSSGDEDQTVEARCVDENQVVVPDENCNQPAGQANVSNGGGGFAFVPIFFGGGGRQYHYNYGGTGGVGQVARGGNVSAPPAGATVRSGTSGSTISRGGLGVNSGGSKSGGLFGGSSSGS